VSESRGALWPRRLPVGAYVLCGPWSKSRGAPWPRRLPVGAYVLCGPWSESRGAPWPRRLPVGAYVLCGPWSGFPGIEGGHGAILQMLRAQPRGTVDQTEAGSTVVRGV